MIPRPPENKTRLIPGHNRYQALSSTFGGILILLTLLIILLAASTVSAETQQLKVTRLSSEQGLSQNTVNTILQDR